MNTQYLLDAILIRKYEKCVFRLGKYNKSAQRAQPIERERQETYESRGRPHFALRPAVRVLVLPKHDDLLPQHAKRLLDICMQGALSAVHVRKTTPARLPSLYEYTVMHDLTKMLEDGMDVGCDGIWRWSDGC